MHISNNSLDKFVADFSTFFPQRGVFWSNFIKTSVLLSVVKILNKKHGFSEMFSLFIRNQTYRLFSFFFILAYFPCYISEIGITFFYNRSSSYKIHALRFPIFWCIVSMKIEITLKIIFNQTSILSKNWCIFHISQIKGRLVKRQLKMLGMVQKKVYRTTLRNLLSFPSCIKYLIRIFEGVQTEICNRICKSTGNSSKRVVM